MNTLAVWWYEYVNSEHFLIGSVLVLLGFGWPVLLAIGLVHEAMDGDLFTAPNAPWEGVKDILWFLAPLIWKL